MMEDGTLLACSELSIGPPPISSSKYRAGLFALNDNGSVARDFGANGQIVSNIVGIGQQAIPLGDNRILVAGGVGAQLKLAKVFSEPAVYVRSDGQVSTEVSGSTFGSTATLTVQRGGDLLNPLTVQLGIGGSATNGIDFTIPSAVTFPAGSDTAQLPVSALEDHELEGDETVIVQLIAPTGFVDASAPGGASVVIKDNQTADRFELNNTQSSATTLNITQSPRRTEPKLSIGPGGDVDYFRVAGNGGGRFFAHIDFQNSEGDLMLKLLNSAGARNACAVSKTN
jgi:hypothetical protein